MAGEGGVEGGKADEMGLHMADNEAAEKGTTGVVVVLLCLPERKS